MALYDSIYDAVIDSHEALTPLINPADSDSLLTSAEIHAAMSDTLSFSISEEVAESDTWLHGMEGASRQGPIIGNSGILSVIVLLFLLISVNFKECSKLITRFSRQLLNIKKRENIFDEHTAHETRLTILMLIQYIVYLSILLSGACLVIKSKSEGLTGDFDTLLKDIGVVTVYYIFQLCAYGVVAYTFSEPDDTRRFIRSLNASQALCGLALIVPTLMILFYPQYLDTLVIIGGAAYLLFRLLFVANGFSIFYRNIFSLVYFILYLCTLEIIPVIYVFKAAML